MTETPEEMGARLAKARSDRFAEIAPAMHMAGGVLAALGAIIDALVAKNVLTAQEALDALVRASDEVQASPEGAVGVQMIEILCGPLRERGGASRPMA